MYGSGAHPGGKIRGAQVPRAGAKGYHTCSNARLQVPQALFDAKKAR